MSKLTQSTAAGPGVVLWFRQDLRLHDQLALARALDLCTRHDRWLLPVFIHDTAQLAPTRWGFARVGPHRQTWQAMALSSLDHHLRRLGSCLLQLSGPPAEVLSRLLPTLGNTTLVCEDIPAPQEQAVISTLQARGMDVQTVWQSTLMAPEHLPFAPEQVADHFTAFRQALERAGTPAQSPLPPPCKLPPLPPAEVTDAVRTTLPGAPPPITTPEADERSSFPFFEPRFHGGKMLHWPM